MKRLGLAIVGALSLAAGLWLGLASEPGARADAARPHANRLAAEASPYLQLHAHNPVDWYPWGEEALARARAEDKPIFLSVGYSTCYWCHVMERKVFSDPEIAALMNASFVSIKVDREERPDLDEIYMMATRLLTGGGGWPNSVFLTPEGQPFFAGTYFPPEDAHGRPGFPTVLERVRQLWSNERERVLSVAQTLTQRIAQASAPGGKAKLTESADQLIERARRELAQSYEPEHGGFSRRTKFPRPPSLELLLAAYARDRDPETLSMVTHTLDEMALGGIYDHLGGGFHRYSTEPTWSVPHFEKMLYDNAQLVAVYARAYAVTGRSLYRHVVEDAIAYLAREMTHPEGGFYSAQDAEVAGSEGASYVWSRSEIAQILGAEPARGFLSVYELAPLHEHPGLGVLRVRLPVAPALERAGAPDEAALLGGLAAERAKLFAARGKRAQPLRDDKVLAAWNGLAIRALVEAALTLDRVEYLRRAERAAHFVLERLASPDGGLHRSYIAGQMRERAVLDDYAFLIDGLLALHRATGEPAWLARARSLTDVMLERLEDREQGGFYLTETDPQLLVRPKSVEDGALPSGNGVALRALRALADLTAEERYRVAAERTAAAAAPLLVRAPSALATTVVALGDGARAPSLAKRSSPEPAARPSLPRSADHVRVALAGEHKRLLVRVTIDEGWHVNANPASFPFLVATEVKLEDPSLEAQVDYPPGRDFRPEFAPEALRVYEGTVEIPVTLARAPPEPPRLTVRYQACNETQCLPPSISRAGANGGASAPP